MLGRIRERLDDPAKRPPGAVVLVTHNVRHAACADRILYLHNGRLTDEVPRLARPESLVRREPV